MASTLKVNTIAHSGGTNAMTIDSSGRLLTPARPSFRAHLSANGAWTDITHSGNYAVVFDAEKYDVGGNYSTSTGRFTVPITGTYYFAARCYLHSNQGTRWLTIAKGTTNPAAGGNPANDTSDKTIKAPNKGFLKPTPFQSTTFTAFSLFEVNTNI